MKNSLLSQILEQDARARRKTAHSPTCTQLALSSLAVNSIALVKPEKAKAVEMMLIRMAQTGQISGKVIQYWCVCVRYTMTDYSVGRREPTGGVT